MYYQQMLSLGITSSVSLCSVCSKHALHLNSMPTPPSFPLSLFRYITAGVRGPRTERGRCFRTTLCRWGQPQKILEKDRRKRFSILSGGSRILKGGFRCLEPFYCARECVHEAGDTWAQNEKKGGSAEPKEPPWIHHWFSTDWVSTPNASWPTGISDMKMQCQCLKKSRNSDWFGIFPLRHSHGLDGKTVSCTHDPKPITGAHGNNSPWSVC